MATADRAPVATDKPSDCITLAPRYTAAGMATADRALVVTGQPTNTTFPGHTADSITVADRAPVVTGQPANTSCPRHTAGYIAATDLTLIASGQPANTPPTCHVDLFQIGPHDGTGKASNAEKTSAASVVSVGDAVDMQVAESVPAAVEGGVEWILADADGQPAAAFRPPGIDCARGVAGPVPEVQGLGKFVPGAIVARTDYSVSSVGKRGGISL